MPTFFDIRDHGAVGDGVSNDAKAIQAAIDECTTRGGGTVVVPAGAVYLAGSIVLRSNVELHVERGATLQCSGDWTDITERSTVSALSGGVITPETVESGQFITAHGAENVAITGAGTIDGGGRHYVLENLGPIYRMPNARPFTVFLIGCTDVTITDTLFRDAALWTVRLTGCESVLIRGIRIRNDMLLPNADGIDLDHCRRVRVSDCDIRCPDDAISLKTCEEFPDAGPCEDITVTNCVLESRSSALVIGVDVVQPIRNVVVSNCVIRDSHRGLSVNLGQKTQFENILFTGIVVETRIDDDAWWGRGEPIYVSAMPWHDEVGTVRNVRFVNILARSENGAYVEGFERGLIEGILLDNVRIELEHRGELAGGRYDRRPYSGAGEIVDHPTAGFYVKNADDVTLRNCEVVWAGESQPWHGPAVETVNAGVVVEGFRGDSARPGEIPAMVRS
ncbi:glycosyl hydrolase family 28 protein [Kribbella italica]|uniref:Glycoside hydrolase family 28 protein n=1 Tax=Kribbella italica TaxID=1540520 RepID=A0A7W9J516_9ACTN|nr:hypothetical protein [Kribbella italica]